jgi:hypothetical protein
MSDAIERARAWVEGRPLLADGNVVVLELLLEIAQLQGAYDLQREEIHKVNLLIARKVAVECAEIAKGMDFGYSCDTWQSGYVSAACDIADKIKERFKL